MKALVTGASSLIAKELIPLLQNKGYKVFATSRELEKPQSLKDLDLTYLSLDLCQKSGQDKLLDLCEKEVFTLIIQNAGAGYYGRALTHGLEKTKNIFEVNALFPSLFSIFAATCLKKEGKGGIILNICSATDEIIYPFFASYSASKAALSHFSQALYAEMKEEGIFILVSSFGHVKTDFQKKASLGLYDSKKNDLGLSPLYVAKRLIKQIETKKSYDVFPFSVRLLRGILKILPKDCRSYFLKKSLEGRF